MEKSDNGTVENKQKNQRPGMKRIFHSQSAITAKNKHIRQRQRQELGLSKNDPSVAYSYCMALLLWTILAFCNSGSRTFTSPSDKQWDQMERTVIKLQQELKDRLDSAEYTNNLSQSVEHHTWNDQHQHIRAQSLFWMSTKDKQPATMQRFAITELYYFSSSGTSSWTTCCPTCRTCNNGMPILSPHVHECEWYGITCNDSHQITRIEWTDNGLSSITQDWPLHLSLLSNLELLWLSNNPNLSHTIPTWIHKLTSLQSLSLFHTSLKGEIPVELYRLSSLTALRLYATQLSGTISPQIGTLTNLSWLWLHQNQLSSGIPPELVALTKLEGLTLYGNDFTDKKYPPNEICLLKEHHVLTTYIVDCQRHDESTKCSCCSRCFPTTK